ncbi:MAG: hypothetical protein Q9O24_06960 [Gammaproteobacteria bacterium]|nr:hypothetical protein [Gammaproteobacteria bacterium]
MKRIQPFYRVIFALFMLVGAQSVLAAEKLKPFILANAAGGSLQEATAATEKALQGAGFEVVGTYASYDGVQLVLVSSDELKKAAAATKRGAYAAVQRVSLVKRADKIEVAYTNPVYWANAYQLESDLAGVSKALADALGAGEPFGAKGLTADDLRGYHYTFGMEYFDEPYELAEFVSFEAAVAQIDKGLKAKTAGVSMLYRVEIPGRDQVLFGVAMQKGAKGDKYSDDAFIMSVVDFEKLSSAAHLPYEILVNGKQAEALHARFRIAISFPDLNMMGDNSFMKIMESPPAIERALQAVAGVKAAESDY